jgi:hypothetical protein
MKKILVLLIMCFVLATSAFATEVNDYLDAKQAFEDAKFDYQECTKKCDDLEADVLTAAKDYVEESTDLVSSKLKGIKDYVDDETIDLITSDLLTLLDIPDEIDEATSKEDLQKIALKLAGIWSKYKDTVDEYNVDDYYNSVNEIYEKGDLLDDIIECSIEEAESDVSNVELRYGAFDGKMDEVEGYLNSALENLETAPETALENIGSAVTALGEADELLGKLMQELTDSEVSLVEECDTTEADDDDDVADNDDDDTGDNDDDEADDDDDTVSDEDFDDLLDDADLDGDYNSALAEIENAEDMITEKQDDCYITTQAEVKLDEAYGYMDTAYQAVLDDDIGLAWTSMENAKDKAETAQLSAYYSAGTCSDDDDDVSPASVEEFKECLEDAATSLYRNYCYSDYDISEDQQDDIEECFLAYPTSEEEEECIDPIDDLDADSGDDDDDDGNEVTLEIEIEDFSYDGDSMDLEEDITLKIEGTTYSDNDYDVELDNGDLTIELEAVISDNDDLTIDFEDEDGNEFQFKCRLLIDDEELKRVEFTVVAEDFSEDFEESTVTFDFEGNSYDTDDTELSSSGKEIEFENDEDEEFDFGSGLDFDIYGEDDDSDSFEYDGKITVDIT